MAENATNRVKSLKQELREALQLAQQLSATPGPELDAAVLKAAQLRDRMNDVNEQVGVLTAGSKFEALGNQLGDIGGKILSLDFEGANESAERLVQLTKNIKFADAVKGVKDLGSTFLNLGKSLLTNPLFLIASVIGLAVAAVVKLLDKMGVLKKIGEAVGFVFEKIGEFIEWIADKVSIVVDAIFGTTLVAEKQAQKLAEQQDKLLEKTKARSQAVTDAADREIKEQKALGKNTEALERKKLELIVKTAQVEFDIYNQRINNRLLLKGLDEEEIKNLKEKFNESKKALLDAKSDLKVFNNEQKKERDDAAKKDLEAQKANNDKARQLAKQYAADRLAAERQIKDLELANLEDGIEKELAINEEKYKRLIEDTKRNEKLNNDEKKKIINELLIQEISNEEKIRDAARKKKEEQDKKDKDFLLSEQSKYLDEIERLNEENYQATLNNQQKEIDAVENKYADLINQAQGNAEELAIIEAAKNRELTEINDRYRLEELQKERDKLNESLNNIKNYTSEIAGIFSQLDGLGGQSLSKLASAVGTITNVFQSTNDQLNKLNDDLAAGLITQEEFAQKRIEVVGEQVSGYANAIGNAITGILNAVADANKEALDRDIANIDEKNTREQESLQAKLDAGLISREQFEKQSSDLDKKANAEKDKKGKEAFEKNKKLQIATASIQGLQGAVSAFAGAMSLGPIAGPIVGGVLAAAVAGLTAANIAKIKSTKYESASSGGGGSSSVSLGGSSSSSSQAAQPQFNLFGQGNNQNTVNASGQPMINNQVQVQSQVSVTEITSTQNKVKVIEERSSL